jgi:glycosyltransferase involved in cell wall biosynthesis
MPSGKSSLVSIVLPTYNGARYVKQSIDSCLNQTYKNVELIIVDDGSSDETPQIIKSYSDSRIKYIRCTNNNGLPNALNIGFANSTGTYLTWTSNDNEYIPTAIEEMVTYLRKDKTLDVVYADCWLRDLDTNSVELHVMPEITYPALENQVGACFLYTRQVYETVGYYNPKYRLVEDYDYWIRVTKQFKAGHYSKALYYYGVHSESLTKTKPFSIMLLAQILRYKYGFISLFKMSELTYKSNMPGDIIPYLKSVISVSTRSFEFCTLCSISLFRAFVQALPKYLRRFLSLPFISILKLYKIGGSG